MKIELQGNAEVLHALEAVLANLAWQIELLGHASPTCKCHTCYLYWLVLSASKVAEKRLE